MSDKRQELRARAEADGIEFFLAMFVDMHGKPCAKLVPMASFDLLMDGGAGFAGFAAGPMGQDPSDPDMSAAEKRELLDMIKEEKIGLSKELISARE